MSIPFICATTFNGKPCDHAPTHRAELPDGRILILCRYHYGLVRQVHPTVTHTPISTDAPNFATLMDAPR